MVEEVTRQKLLDAFSRCAHGFDNEETEGILECIDALGLCIMPKEATEEIHESMCEGWFKGDWEMPVVYAGAVSAFQRQLKGE